MLFVGVFDNVFVLFSNRLALKLNESVVLLSEDESGQLIATMINGADIDSLVEHACDKSVTEQARQQTQGRILGECAFGAARTEIDTPRDQDGRSFDREERVKYCHALVEWLQKCQLPVELKQSSQEQESGDESGPTISILDSVFIRWPYRKTDCESFNELVLEKVQHMLDTFATRTNTK